MSGSTRREFCLHVCQLASLAGGAAVAGACSGGPSSPTQGSTLVVVNATVASGLATLNVGGSSPLATVGGRALVQSTAGSFLVARTASASCTALTATCTHEGCTVTETTGFTYLCPCHGSQFSTNGSVVQGPAGTPLATKTTALSGDVLTITH